MEDDVEAPPVRWSIEDGVADVRLARAEHLNAIDEPMLDAMLDIAGSLHTRRNVRAVVLSGEGPSFCTGRDTRIFGTGGTAALTATVPFRGQHQIRRTQATIWAWRDLPIPVICAVQGHALGGGLQLAAAADVRFATADSKWAMMEVKWGLLPDMGALAILRRLLRDDVLRYLALSGRTFSGEEAAAYGIVTKLANDPRAEALEFARELAALSPHAVRAGKQILNTIAIGDPTEALELESSLRAALVGSPNQGEAVRARRERRAPKFVEPDVECG